MLQKILFIVVNKTLKNTSPLNSVLHQFDEVEADIQRGQEALLDTFGSPEAVDAHIEAVKNRLRNKLFSTPVICTKENCTG